MSTISLSVLLNGISYRHMKPIKGIRQGDILSPCFFIHSSKGLIKMFKFDERNEYIKGVCATKNAPLIYHHMFTDDLLCFTRHILLIWIIF